MARITPQIFAQALDKTLTKGDVRRGMITSHTWDHLSQITGVSDEVLQHFLVDGVFVDMERFEDPRAIPELAQLMPIRLSEFVVERAYRIRPVTAMFLRNLYFARDTHTEHSGDTDLQERRRAIVESVLTPTAFAHALNRVLTKGDVRRGVITPLTWERMSQMLGVPHDVLQQYLTDAMLVDVEAATTGPWARAPLEERYDIRGVTVAFLLRLYRRQAHHADRSGDSELQEARRTPQMPTLEETQLTMDVMADAVRSALHDEGVLPVRFKDVQDSDAMQRIVSNAARRVGFQPDHFKQWCRFTFRMIDKMNYSGLQPWQVWMVAKISDYATEPGAYWRGRKSSVNETVIEPVQQYAPVHKSNTEDEKLKAFHFVVIAQSLVKALALSGTAHDPTKLFPAVSMEVVHDAIKCSALEPVVFLKALNGLGAQLIKTIRERTMQKYDMLCRQTIEPVMDRLAADIQCGLFELAIFIAAHEEIERWDGVPPKPEIKEARFTGGDVLKQWCWWFSSERHGTPSVADYDVKSMDWNDYVVNKMAPHFGTTPEMMETAFEEIWQDVHSKLAAKGAEWNYYYNVPSKSEWALAEVAQELGVPTGDLAMFMQMEAPEGMSRAPDPDDRD